MGEHFDLYFAGWYNDDMMKIIIENDYNQLLSNINERDQIYKYIEAKKRIKSKKLITLFLTRVFSQ